MIFDKAKAKAGVQDGSSMISEVAKIRRRGERIMSRNGGRLAIGGDIS
jgi:hypothetical protein